MNWRLGVVGSPIAHSLSPTLHEAGLRQAGLGGTSQRIELGEDDAATLARLLGAEFDALSVTAPLKRAAFEISSDHSEVAARTHSVNSLLWRDDVILGASTDGGGFIEGYTFEAGMVIANAHVVILGAGGAASGILDAVISAEAATAVVHSRDDAKAEALTDPYPNAFASSLVYRPIDVIVNTVPRNVRGREAAVLQGVRPDTLAIDITYGEAKSPWQDLYEAAGCRSVDGRAMLAFQAALQMQWWWDTPIDGAALLRAIR
jgi:shikimate dehydrogenase